MLFLGHRGYRVIAHDRRGHGRSAQTWDGNDMDTYADDLAELFETLDLRDAVLVGHSTGGGEVARYIGRHGTTRVAKAVLIGAVPPLMLQDRGQSGRPADRGVRRLPRRRDRRPLAVLQGPVAAVLRFQPAGRERLRRRARHFLAVRACRRASSRRVTTASRRFPRPTRPTISRRFDVPTLILHGDDDQIVPIAASALLSAKLVPNATLKVYPGGPHGMCTTQKDEVNADLLAFIAG